MSGLEVTPASEWGGGQLLQLPSGRVVRVADPPPNLMALAIEGSIPMEIVEAVKDSDGDLLEQLLLEHVDKLCAAVVLDPPVTIGAGPAPDGSILFRWLSNEDTATLTRLLLERTRVVAADAASFRDEPSGTPDDPSSPPVGDDPEPAAAAD